MLQFLNKHSKELVLFALAFLFLGKFESLLGKEQFEPQEDLKDKDKFNENSATLTDVEAKSIAEGFYAATVTEGLENTFEMVKPLFARLKNQADFNKVYNAFGKRQYSTYWGNVGDPFFSSRHDLLAILNEEISKEKEKKFIRDNYPQIKVF